MYKLNPPDLNTRWTAAHDERRNITFPPTAITSGAALLRKVSADSFTHVQKCHSLEGTAIALGEKKKTLNRLRQQFPSCWFFLPVNKMARLLQLLPKLSGIRSNHRNFKATLSHRLFYSLLARLNAGWDT